MRAAALLAVAAVLALCGPARGAQVLVDMRAVVIGTVEHNDTTVLHVITQLRGAGIDFDYINVVTDCPSGTPLPLQHPDGHAKYQAVILTSRELGYEMAPGHWQSALTTAQWAQLATYQDTFSVRSLSLYSWPWWAGVQTAATGLPDSHAMFRSGAVGANNAVNDPALKADARVPMTYSWVTPADTSGSLSVTCVADYYGSADPSDTTKGGCAAAIEQLSSKSERFHFFFVPTIYHPGQIVALNAALHWAVRGIFMGERRIVLGMQIDDLFLKTPEWEKGVPYTDDQPDGSRCTASDMDDLKAYVDAANAALPAGSSLNYEWALNGQGVAENGGMPSGGSGGDALAGAVQTTHRDTFLYVTHTFTHPNLDGKSRNFCKKEITDNTAFVNSLWGAGNLPATWGENEMVPPSISGLFTGACLQGLQDAGIFTVVGDNSRPELRPQTYGGTAYQGLWTTVATNGYAGTFIIPRHATNIYFNNAEVQNNLDHFNDITGFSWTWDQLMAYEGDLTARYLLQFRHDPYMFHQANVVAHTPAAPATSYPYGLPRMSLMSLWTEAVLKEMRKWNAFPIVTWSQKEMRERLLKRMARDTCNIDGHWVVQDGTIIEVLVAASNTCEAAVTGIDPAGASSYQSEVYGTEPTVYVPISAAAGTIAIPSGRTPPPPACKPACGPEGTCDLTAKPPVCVCNNGWTGPDCTTQTEAWGANWLINPGFENTVAGSSPLAPQNWWTFVTPPAVVTDTANSGARSIRVTNADTSAAGGVYQLLSVGQGTARKMRITGWSRATDVSGAKDTNYGIYADIMYTDGSWLYGNVAPFETGTHGWQQAELIVDPAKPIADMWVYAMFRYHSGVAEFDDVSVQMEVDPKTGPVSLDGRCGFNSPLNAICPTYAPCCSQYGWCQSTCNPEPLPTPTSQCSNCWGDSSGPCKAPNTVCYDVDPETLQCPAGTTACEALPALNSESTAVVEADLTVEGVTTTAFTEELQDTFAKAVSDEAGVTSGGADVTNVDPAPASSGATQKARRLSVTIVEHGGRALGASSPGGACVVPSSQHPVVNVRVVVASAEGGPSATEMSESLGKAVKDGKLDARLQSNGMGVKTSMNGVRVKNDPTCSRGTDWALLSAVGAVALLVGGCAGFTFVTCRQQGDVDVDAVKAVDPRKVRATGSSNSLTNKLSLPRLGSAGRAGSKRREYDAVGTQQSETGTLLTAGGAKSERARTPAGVSVEFDTEGHDEPIGTVTPRGT